MTYEEQARRLWAKLKGSTSSPASGIHLGVRQYGATFWQDHESAVIADLAAALANASDLSSLRKGAEVEMKVARILDHEAFGEENHPYWVGEQKSRERKDSAVLKAREIIAALVSGSREDGADG